MRWLLFLVLILPAWAQLPRGFYPWWERPIARDMGLTEDQMRQIRTILRERRSKMIDLRAAVEKAEGDVEDLFNEENFDQAKASEAIERLVATRAELTRMFSQMSLKLRAILTPQQWHELQRRRPQMQPQPPFRRENGRPNRPPEDRQ
jgi:Spy/CpxP family protein refolding chaperone